MAAVLTLTVNGETLRTSALTIGQLVTELDFSLEKVAVERNGSIVPRSTLPSALLADGDVLEIVHFVGGGDHAPAKDDSWTVAGRTFRSRLIVGTGKYKDFAAERRRARGIGRGDRHRRGAPGQRVATPRRRC